MNSKHILLALLGATTIFSGCRKDDLELPEQQIPSSPVQEVFSADREALPHVIRVRFAREQGEAVERMLASAKHSTRLEAGSVPLLDKIHATSLRRVFPYAGKYEARTRREGLHLWYDITLDTSLPTARAREARQKALEAALQSSEVTSAELVYVAKLPQTKAIYLDSRAQGGFRSGALLPANDPELGRQWHYHNDGSLIRSKRGADINLFKAWELEQGRPEVIVSVVDGGVDYNHEDLRDNMFVNKAERDGVEGEDDDNNGLVDDIYGYNFVFMNGQINPHSHGTHVAGTVAARTNNGIGVAGVAGGDGTPGSGIRLMTCQAFDVNPENNMDIGRGFEAAIKYGADNGAVISQNSWGTPKAPQLQPSYREAIDYFIKYAGCDNDGKQLPTSPMKGGVVIFAAGNSGVDEISYPAAYPPVVSVSAMSTNFEVSPYSNRGDWVNIMAPGGDAYQHHGQVLSTLPDNQYGYMEGTSMACPHVSGVAALIVSKFGGPGFTNEELKRRLKTAISGVDINRMNPDYAGRLGVGYLDARAALADDLSHRAPAPAVWSKAEATHTGLLLAWRVSEDEDDQKAFGYRLYISKEQLSEANLASARMIEVTNVGAKVGEEIHYSLHGLEVNTRYFLALKPYDRWGNVGKLTLRSATTLSNHAPQITLPSFAPIRLSGEDTYTLTASVSDPDGHEWEYKLLGDSHGVSAERVGDEVKLHLRILAAPGRYRVKLQATDALGASAEVEIPFEIYHNAAPRQAKAFGRHYLPLGSTPLRLDLATYFEDADEEELTYAVRVLGMATVSASIEQGVLLIKGDKRGLSGLEVSATDPRGQVAKAALEVEVVADEIVHLVYPTPVSKTLNIRLADRLRSAALRILTPTGSLVLSRELRLVEGQSVVQLDVSSLSTGTYLLEVDAEGKTHRQSFIKR